MITSRRLTTFRGNSDIVRATGVDKSQHTGANSPSPASRTSQSEWLVRVGSFADTYSVDFTSTPTISSSTLIRHSLSSFGNLVLAA